MKRDQQLAAGTSGPACSAPSFPDQHCPACGKLLFARGAIYLPVVGKCCHCGTFIERDPAFGDYRVPNNGVTGAAKPRTVHAVLDSQSKGGEA